MCASSFACTVTLVMVVFVVSMAWSWLLGPCARTIMLRSKDRTILVVGFLGLRIAIQFDETKM